MTASQMQMMLQHLGIAKLGMFQVIEKGCLLDHVYISACWTSTSDPGQSFMGNDVCCYWGYVHAASV